MTIRRWKHAHWQLHVLGWLQGLAGLADAVVTLCSLGCLSSSFELDMASKRARYSFTLAQRKADALKCTCAHPFSHDQCTRKEGCKIEEKLSRRRN